jgi:hypothetical protein
MSDSAFIADLHFRQDQSFKAIHMAHWFGVNRQDGSVDYVDLDKVRHMKFIPASDGQDATVSLFFDEEARVVVTDVKEINRLLKMTDKVRTAAAKNF